jgi:hypothetical protein
MIVQYTPLFDLLNFKRLMPVDLLANIGGIFGFFLGMSFLSLVKLIEIIIEGLVNFFGKQIQT